MEAKPLSPQPGEYLVLGTQGQFLQGKRLDSMASKWKNLVWLIRCPGYQFHLQFTKAARQAPVIRGKVGPDAGVPGRDCLGPAVSLSLSCTAPKGHTVYCFPSWNNTRSQGLTLFIAWVTVQDTDDLSTHSGACSVSSSTHVLQTLLGALLSFFFFFCDNVY